jgi:hypothetical protein
MTVEPPVDDEDVPRYWRELGLPGLVDVHVHFLPERVQAKVWQFFAAAQTHYGPRWPITYELPVEDRLAVLERLGVRAFPTLPYAHKGGMAAWLNDWSREFAAQHPQVLQSATFHPEPEAPAYVAEALAAGVRVFKVHVQVGGSIRATGCSIRCGRSWRRPARRWSSTAARARWPARTPGPSR